MNRSYSKIRHIQEANQNLESRLMVEQSNITSSVVSPDVIENFYRKNIKEVMGSWSTLDDLKKLYSILSSLSGKTVKGVSKCFDAEHQTAGKPINTTALDYVNKLNYWQLQDKCGDESGGPSYNPLFDEIERVGTMTLGKEGDVLKKRLLDLLSKNGVKPIQ